MVLKSQDIHHCDSKLASKWFKMTMAQMRITYNKPFAIFSRLGVWF